MRLLLDTHAFIWLNEGDARLPVSTRSVIDAADELLLSVASVWEAEMKRAAGRLNIAAMEESAARADIPLLPIAAAHATVAAHLPRHHRDPFDRLLVAQAQLESLVLVTKDAVLRRYSVAIAW